MGLLFTSHLKCSLMISLIFISIPITLKMLRWWSLFAVKHRRQLLLSNIIILNHRLQLCDKSQYSFSALFSIQITNETFQYKLHETYEYFAVDLTVGKCHRSLGILSIRRIVRCVYFSFSTMVRYMHVACLIDSCRCCYFHVGYWFFELKFNCSIQKIRD